MNRRKIGREQEQRAAAFLEEQGYRVITMNYYSRHGEIDIVAMDQGYLVFVEVKYRRDAGFGYPAEAVGLKKRRSIIYTARNYMSAAGLADDVPCRFDVISILGEEISLLKNCWEWELG